LLEISVYCCAHNIGISKELERVIRAAEAPNGTLPLWLAGHGSQGKLGSNNYEPEDGG
jgi:hypothetical protein